MIIATTNNMKSQIGLNRIPKKKYATRNANNKMIIIGEQQQISKQITISLAILDETRNFIVNLTNILIFTYLSV